MKYMSRPKSAAVNNIDVDSADILNNKYRYRINISKGDIDPPVIETELRVGWYWFVFFAAQLDLIVDLLGSPVEEDIRGACEPAKAYVRSKGHLSSKIAALYQLSPDCDDFVMHLMCQMLTFNPVFDSFCYMHFFVCCCIELCWH